MEQESENCTINTIRDRLLKLVDNQSATKCAFLTAWGLIVDTNELINGTNFPAAVVSSDGDQGIKITWEQEESIVHTNEELFFSSLNKIKKLELYCSATSDKYTYLYYELDDKSNVLHDVSALTLACWLQWFNLNRLSRSANDREPSDWLT